MRPARRGGRCAVCAGRAGAGCDGFGCGFLCGLLCGSVCCSGLQFTGGRRCGHTRAARVGPLTSRLLAVIAARSRIQAPCAGSLGQPRWRPRGCSTESFHWVVRHRRGPGRVAGGQSCAPTHCSRMSARPRVGNAARRAGLRCSVALRQSRGRSHMPRQLLRAATAVTNGDNCHATMATVSLPLSCFFPRRVAMAVVLPSRSCRYGRHVPAAVAPPAPCQPRRERKKIEEDPPSARAVLRFLSFKFYRGHQA